MGRGWWGFAGAVGVLLGVATPRPPPVAPELEGPPETPGIEADSNDLPLAPPDGLGIREAPRPVPTVGEYTGTLEGTVAGRERERVVVRDAAGRLVPLQLPLDRPWNELQDGAQVRVQWERRGDQRVLTEVEATH